MENKTRGKTAADKVLQVIAKKMIEHDTDEWPPKCGIFTYQPLRPYAGCPEARSKDPK
ncbi:MAG: hypothetical protein ACI3V4_12740 [Faecousia sp.]